MIGVSMPQIELWIDDYIEKHPKKSYFAWCVLMLIARDDAEYTLKEISRKLGMEQPIVLATLDYLLLNQFITVTTTYVKGAKTHFVRINRDIVKPVNPIDHETYLNVLAMAIKANRKHPLMSAMGFQVLIAVYFRGVVKQSEVVRYVRSTFPQNVDRVIRQLCQSGALFVVDADGQTGTRSKKLLLPVS